MSLDRTALRLAVPPILALGLVISLVRPGDAAPATPPQPRAASVYARGLPIPRIGAAVTETVTVQIPTVAFPTDARSTGGRVELPVALTEPGLTGVAYLQGAAICRTPLAPGAVSWLRCDAPGGRTRIIAELSDGRRIIGPLVTP